MNLRWMGITNVLVVAAVGGRGGDLEDVDFWMENQLDHTLNFESLNIAFGDSSRTAGRYPLTTHTV